MVMIEMRVKIVKSERRIVVFPGFFMCVVRPRLYAIEIMVLSKMLYFVIVGLFLVLLKNRGSFVGAD